jgi:hypothetical protein
LLKNNLSLILWEPVYISELFVALIDVPCRTYIGATNSSKQNTHKKLSFCSVIRCSGWNKTCVNTSQQAPHTFLVGTKLLSHHNRIAIKNPTFIPFKNRWALFKQNCFREVQGSY